MVGLKRGRLGQARRARSKIHPGHDCARSRPHGTALLLAMAKEAKCSSGLAFFRSMKSDFRKAAEVPWLRSEIL